MSNRCGKEKKDERGKISLRQPFCNPEVSGLPLSREAATQQEGEVEAEGGVEERIIPPLQEPPANVCSAPELSWKSLLYGCL